MRESRVLSIGHVSRRLDNVRECVKGRESELGEKKNGPRNGVLRFVDISPFLLGVDRKKGWGLYGREVALMRRYQVFFIE